MQITPQNQIFNSLYDPVICRFFSPDNYVVENESTQDFNRYSYARNCPLMYTDPTGNLYNPIFDWNGTLLGTDDLGIQGEAIIMNEKDFRQGMSHNDALRLGTLRSQLSMMISSNILDKIDNQVAGFPSRPDWDGKLTLAEANDWYRNGNGDPLYVNAALIDLSPIYIGDIKLGEPKSVNYASPRYANFETGLVYGRISLTALDLDGAVRIGKPSGLIDNYGFEMHPGETARNAATRVGAWVAGKGTPFDIYGTGQLRQRPAPTLQYYPMHR